MTDHRGGPTVEALVARAQKARAALETARQTAHDDYAQAVLELYEKVGAVEAATLLGVHVQRIYQLIRRARQIGEQ